MIRLRLPKPLHLRRMGPWDLVYEAVRSGRLRRLDGSVPCVDCGKPARCYDHRDYAKPLDVAAVCVGCNGRRGPGLPRPPRRVEGDPVSFRLDPRTLRGLELLSRDTGLDKSGAVRLAIRDVCKLRGLEIPEDPEDQPQPKTKGRKAG